MGLKEVKEEILNRAHKEAEAVLAEAKKEIDGSRQNAEAKAREYRDKAEEATKRLLETMERRELAQAEFDARKAILDKKKELIDKVIDNVKKHLANLSEKKREEYIHHLIEKAKKEIDVAIVYANPKDKRAVQMVKSIEFKPKDDLLGGIIAQTADGKISVDYSYEEIIADIQEKSLQELGKMLFKH
ncbi:hypothetical protein HY488_01640 [Candidatus Woesearchaeota archaeon]|nr:hypothetical protein [Candidatus Woesearchaeota archaeon]